MVGWLVDWDGSFYTRLTLPIHTAPKKNTQQQEGQTISLKDFKGSYVALYFYNKDDTPVVTRGGGWVLPLSGSTGGFCF